MLQLQIVFEILYTYLEIFYYLVTYSPFLNQKGCLSVYNLLFVYVYFVLNNNYLTCKYYFLFFFLENLKFFKIKY